MSTMLMVGSFATFTACKPTEEIDPDKTQLYVSIQACGLGSTFLTSLKTAYEAKNPDVQIVPITDGPGGSEVLAEVQNGGSDVYMFTNSAITDFVGMTSQTSNYFADITDIVTEKGDDNKSIHDKLFEGTKDYYNVNTEEAPKYFALPWFNSYFGTVYDVDLFESRHLYSTDPLSELKGSYVGYDGKKGTADDDWGPDGIEGSFDDGLPATYEDLKALWVEMDAQDIIPYSWTSFDGYSQGWLSMVWASYEGTNYELMKDFNGTYYTSNNSPVEINNDNGYLLAYMNGKRAALQVAEDIIRGEYYLKISDNTSQDNIAAQTSYLKSIESDYPIAFLMEGSWWENESKAVFEEMATYIDAKYAYGERRFGLMPFPRFIGTTGIPNQVNEKVTFMGGDIGNGCSAIAINKNTKVMDIAKDFVKFAYSDEMNVDFNIESGVSRPINYDIPESAMERLTYYQKNVYEISQNENLYIVNGGTRSSYAVQEPEFLASISGFKALSPSNVSWSNPLRQFIQDSTLTAEAFMTGVQKLITKDQWDKYFVNK